MIKILANDGIDSNGKEKLSTAGYQITTNTIPQNELKAKINEFDVLLVRSATKVTKEIIDSAKNLKLIGRGGVGLDNIDVNYATLKGIKVINTPSSSSTSVAELVFSHLFGMVRFLPDSNRKMPQEGQSKFKDLKNNYSKGIELKNKTLGIVGLGRIGREVARIAAGIGMDVIAYDLYSQDAETTLDLHKRFVMQSIKIKITTLSLKEVLERSDFITLHTPFEQGDKPLISKQEFDMMKNGVGIVNCSRGGVVNERDLLDALNTGKVAFAGIDVFENEPSPIPELLQHPKISLTPHIGASTVEAQKRIGVELAEEVIRFFNNGKH